MHETSRTLLIGFAPNATKDSTRPRTPMTRWILALPVAAGLLCLMMTVVPVCAATWQFTLSWQDNASDFTGFYLQRKTGTTGTYATIATLPATQFSYIDSGLPVGASYCYEVLAYNATGTSTPSNEVCGTVPSSFPVTVGLSGTGSGTVASSPAGITCGSSCTASFPPGTVVTLTAAPGTGSTFTGWNGACFGTSTCTLTMSAARSVTASFALAAPSTYTLSVTKAGTGSGTVTSSPAGITCGSTCSASFTSGASVTLTAATRWNAVFVGWNCTGTSSSTCQSTARSLNISLTGNTTVQATFRRRH